MRGGAGTSSNDENDLTPDYIRYGTSGHNCGAKCLIKAHVKNGVIKRFVTDESIIDTTGQVIDSENPNCSASRACSKCRSYKFRLYHPGRLKYPLKQTKKRGDLSGFIRISWEQALDEIARKHKAITDKYGPESFHSIYACGAYSSSWQGGGYTGIWTGISTSAAASLMGGYAKYTHDYSFHQRSFFGTGYTGYNGSSANANTVASAVKNVVLWGSNVLSTVNSSAYSEIRSVEMMKQRGGKVWFIGPEFVDTGVTLADTWYQMKPYTDTALILGMLYHAIDTTFDADGNKKTGGLLDVDYIDTMVYGFFDSPEYWIETNYTKGTDTAVGTDINENAGKIYIDQTTAKSEIDKWDKETGPFTIGRNTYPYRWKNKADTSLYVYQEPIVKVNAVPAGRSLSAYIMGSDARLTKAAYSGNYVADQFASKQAKRNGSICSYISSAGNTTKYKTKKDFLKPKNTKWASDITGIPEQAIKDLAELYFNQDNHPIYSEWCGAQQKQANGVINMFALQALLILSKSWGQTGDGLGRAFGGARSNAEGTLNVSISRPDVPSSPATPVISCTQWHNAIKFAFKEQLTANGYSAKYIPDWDYRNSESGVYYEDGGAKALYTWDREADGTIKTNADGYYKWKTGKDGKPLKAGFRFILNSGGNIPMNQHMDPNDAREMFEALDLGSTQPDNPDTFCMVSFDNFLSPSPRWSDYVLPAATTWEQEDIISISLGNSLYIPVVSNAPGQAKSQWNFTNDLLKAVGKLKGVGNELATKFTGGIPNQQIEDLVKDAFGKASVNPQSLYHGKTWEDFINNPYAPKTASEYAPVTVTKTTLRENLDNYLAGNMSQAFISGIKTNEKTGYGAQWLQSTIDLCPKASGRFHVYSDSLVYCYEHRFEQWHGYLASKGQATGQANKDFENDPLVYPIPLYYAYEDYFNEAYGVMNGKNTLDMSKGYLLTTTHDRYRAHSSQSENPYLRELTHRIKGGALYSGNDWNEYGNIGAVQEVKAGETANLARLNQTISNGQPIAGKENVASWSEVWMNNQDAAAEGIADGQLITIGNPIGDVRVIARVTDRVVRGFIGLHQGCWYDPDPVDGIDDGGCANTLMAQRPSRVDHGNGQQSAMVWIKNK
ncbi:molybdopterin-dependent oxidoreductase [Mucispirillum schaedleri]|uniref:molybdopterin-dependent oxidoreductase n=1 Tax=Mucispirillum schaedleri TaxID=248039 RepID=UPI003221D4A6